MVNFLEHHCPTCGKLLLLDDDLALYCDDCGYHFSTMEERCPKCGTLMFWENEWHDVLICPSCKYEYKPWDDEDDEDTVDFFYDDTPEGCAACGGPYPNCKDSCNLFDD